LPQLPPVRSTANLFDNFDELSEFKRFGQRMLDSQLRQILNPFFIEIRTQDDDRDFNAFLL
jgi:hypothetical protein